MNLPKPKPRTIFRTESVISDVSTNSMGDGDTESTKTTSAVNRILPRKSRKSYPAPIPKLRNVSIENSEINSDNSSKSDSSQTQVFSLNDNEILNRNNENVLNKIKENELNEKCIKQRTDSLEETVVVNSNSSEVNPSSDEDLYISANSSTSSVLVKTDLPFITEKSLDALPLSDGDSYASISSSTSSVFLKTDIIPENIKKLKEYPSDNSLCKKVTENNKGRNFSVGNLEDVPAFLSNSPQLGRWKNMECLAEACPSACGNEVNSGLHALFLFNSSN